MDLKKKWIAFCLWDNCSGQQVTWADTWCPGRLSSLVPKLWGHVGKGGVQAPLRPGLLNSLFLLGSSSPPLYAFSPKEDSCYTIPNPPERSPLSAFS